MGFRDTKPADRSGFCLHLPETLQIDTAIKFPTVICTQIEARSESNTRKKRLNEQKLNWTAQNSAELYSVQLNFLPVQLQLFVPSDLPLGQTHSQRCAGVRNVTIQSDFPLKEEVNISYVPDCSENI